MRPAQVLLTSILTQSPKKLFYLNCSPLQVFMFDQNVIFNSWHLVYELVYPIWLPRSGWWAGIWVRQSAAYVHLAVSQSGLQIQMVGGSPAAPMNRLWLQFTQTIGSFLHRVNGSSLRLCNCGVVTHVP